MFVWTGSTERFSSAATNHGPMTLDEHAEDLASDLGVDKEEVKEDLANLVNYSVPMDEAKQSLRRKYGDGSEGGSTPSSKEIGDVTC